MKLDKVGSSSKLPVVPIKEADASDLDADRAVLRIGSW